MPAPQLRKRAGLDLIGDARIPLLFAPRRGVAVHRRVKGLDHPHAGWLGHGVCQVAAVLIVGDDQVERRMHVDHEPEIARQIELLKGLVYRGFVTFEWPRLWWSDLAGPEAVLPGAAEYLRARIAEQQEVLTAYKNDKNAAKMASATAY